MEIFQTIGAAAGLFTLGAWALATVWALARAAGKEPPTPLSPEEFTAERSRALYEAANGKPIPMERRR